MHDAPMRIDVMTDDYKNLSGRTLKEGDA